MAAEKTKKRGGRPKKIRWSQRRSRRGEPKGEFVRAKGKGRKCKKEREEPKKKRNKREERKGAHGFS